MLTLGIPKGSLQESTLALFAKAGFGFYGSERSLWLSSNDPEMNPVLLRPQEIPRYVADGTLDCGLAGLDWITETGCGDHVRLLADLCYSKRSFQPVRWVLAVGKDSPFKSVDDLKSVGEPAAKGFSGHGDWFAPEEDRQTRRPLRIATELVKVTEAWLAERGIVAEVDFSWGATEAKVPQFADAIVECTETGASLRANGLEILDTIFESTTQFFANKKTYRDNPWKRTKLDGIALLLKSCLAADAKVSIHVQAPLASVEAIKTVIPADATVSVWEGHNGESMIEIVVDKNASRELLPSLAREGARRISVVSLGMLYE